VTYNPTPILPHWSALFLAVFATPTNVQIMRDFLGTPITIPLYTPNATKRDTIGMLVFLVSFATRPALRSRIELRAQHALTRHRAVLQHHMIYSPLSVLLYSIGHAHGCYNSAWVYLLASSAHLTASAHSSSSFVAFISLIIASARAFMTGAGGAPGAGAGGGGGICPA